ncbi:RICIN domain-containing protein [Streptomyces sp. NPDC046237]|uniref:RICIN domain-containing protein n=1 Tax=Streptomyces sp. NPDC046237 TaxID=3154914 RepID=UPI0033E6115B
MGESPDPLDGVRTLVTGGKALDNPGHSTTPGTQLITYAVNGGANQNWRFTRQPDGSYQLVNVESGLCADVGGGSTAAGARVIQWTCTGGANQRWSVTRRPDGTYTVASVRSGLLLTTASTANGAPGDPAAEHRLRPAAVDDRLTPPGRPSAPVRGAGRPRMLEACR